MDTCKCDRCGATVSCWSVWSQASEGQAGNFCIPCEQEMVKDVEPLAPSVLAAVRDLAKCRTVLHIYTAGQVACWAETRWLNRAEPQIEFKSRRGLKGWKAFAAEVVRAATAREMVTE